MIALWHEINFCQTTVWISYKYTKIPLPLEPQCQSFVRHFFRDCFVWLHNRHRGEVGGESQQLLRQTRQHLPCLKAAWQVRGLWPTRRDLLIAAHVVSPTVETDGPCCGQPRRGTLNCLRDRATESLEVVTFELGLKGCVGIFRREKSI